MSAPIRATAGTLSHDGRAMKYAHGQHAAYVLDKCHCEPCRLANRSYEKERAQRVAPAYVGADPARQHIRFLAEHGIGLKQICRISGVSQGGLTKLVYGSRTRGMGPSKRVRKETLDRILAVMPSHAAAGTRVDAGPTWVLIEEMIAAGVPKSRIAEQLGQKGPGLQLKRTTVSWRNAQAVKRLHTAWSNGELELARRDRHGNTHTATPPVREPDYQDRAEILLDLAELLEARNEQSWRREAACRNRPPHIWFPARGDVKCAEAAKRICRACLVRDQCLSANLDARDGIFGGLSGRERRERRRIELLPVA